MPREDFLFSRDYVYHKIYPRVLWLVQIGFEQGKPSWIELKEEDVIDNKDLWETTEIKTQAISYYLEEFKLMLLDTTNRE
jgi:hypothetical protein